MRRAALSVIFFAGLGACNQATNENFDKEFAGKFRESCVTSSSQGGVPEEVATKVCDCAIAKIDENYSTVDKLGLSVDDVKPLLVQCLNQAVQS